MASARATKSTLTRTEIYLSPVGGWETRVAIAGGKVTLSSLGAELAVDDSTGQARSYRPQRRPGRTEAG
jgi:hypothetical protein